MRIARLLPVLLLAASCAPRSSADEVPGEALREVAAAPREVGRIEDARLGEVSGMAASRRFPGWWWAHNDSGDTARLFLLDASGRTRAIVSLVGAPAFDWEDMAVAGSGANAWVITADIGDNLRFRPEITFARFREVDLPARVASSPSQVLELRVKPQILRARYPEADGPQDAEALVANARGEMLLVTKSTGPSSFYLARWPSQPKDVPVTLRLVAQRQFGSAVSGSRRVREMLVTGADLSPSEKRLAIVTYATLSAWSLPSGAWEKLDWRAVLATTPRVLPLPALPQCESVAWKGEREVLVTTEAKQPPLWAVPVE